jgi:hypothetical protein
VTPGGSIVTILPPGDTGQTANGEKLSYPTSVTETSISFSSVIPHPLPHPLQKKAAELERLVTWSVQGDDSTPPSVASAANATRRAAIAMVSGGRWAAAQPATFAFRGKTYGAYSWVSRPTAITVSAAKGGVTWDGMLGPASGVFWDLTSGYGDHVGGAGGAGTDATRNMGSTGSSTSTDVATNSSRHEASSNGDNSILLYGSSHLREMYLEAVRMHLGLPLLAEPCPESKAATQLAGTTACLPRSVQLLPCMLACRTHVNCLAARPTVAALL